MSGPGRLARRTDSAQPVRELPNAQYGEAAEYRTLQQGAPLPKTPSGDASAAAPGRPAMAPPVGFGEPTQRPDEPVTAGAPVGPGVGPDALGLLPEKNEDLRLRLHAIYTLYPTEELRMLLRQMDR